MEIVYSKHTLKEYCVLLCDDDDENKEGDGGDEHEVRSCPDLERKQEDLLQNLMARSLRIDESEAEYYLATNEYDLKQAMVSHKEDCEWERSQNEAARETTSSGFSCCLGS